MRFIKKISSPPTLEHWKTVRKDAGQSCTYNDLGGQPQTDLKTTLLTEQKSLCCYCQQVITNQSSTIEHFLPQAKFKLHEVEYLNLHLVCKCSRGLKAKDTYCDVRKANDLVINAILHPDCESFFRYSKYGEILPNDLTYPNFKAFNKNLNKLTIQNQAIVHLIKVLNLNSPDLIVKRKKQTNDVLKLIRTLNTRAKVDAYFMKANAKPKSIRFPSLVRYYLEIHRSKVH
jgi:uncharacterized protein (TIGR02646 family)